MGANRDPVFNSTVQGALKKIIYPTGGNLEFEYELNRRYTNGIPEVGPVQSVTVVATRTIDDSETLISSVFVDGYFKITSPQTISISIERFPVEVNEDVEYIKNKYDDFELIKLENGVYTTIGRGRINLVSDQGHKSLEFMVSPGDYYIQSHCDIEELEIWTSVNFANQLNSPNLGAISGGIRVKKLVNNPLIGSPTVKEYEYVNEQGFSSGISNAGGYNLSDYSEESINPPSILPVISNYTIYNSSISENYNMGVQHYYTSIVETTKSLNDLISVRTNYVSHDEYFLGVVPTSIIRYKTNFDNSKSILDKTEYDYEIQRTNVFLRNVRPILEKKAILESEDVYNWDEFHFAQAFRYIKSIKNTNFDGGTPLVTEEKNFYDVSNSNSIFKLISSSRISSNGLTTINKYKYSENYDGSLSSAFINSNVVSPVWEHQIWKKKNLDSVLLSSVVTAYDATIFKPKKVYSLPVDLISPLNNETQSQGKYTSLLSDSRFEERVNYNYDLSGRLVNQQLAKAASVSYHWGYASNLSLYPSSWGLKNYIIGECENALEGEFYIQNFEDDTSAAYGVGHTGNRYYQGDFMVPWTIPNSRAYTLEYWYLTGGVWNHMSQVYSGPVLLNLGEAIDDVRIYPSDSKLTTHTYLPGVGISSSIDAKGMTTYYEYDDFQRLEYIKDHAGNILKSYNYHYKP